MRHDTPLKFRIIRIVEQTHRVRERRLQARVTDTDIQRIGVIHNRQQVFHTRLTGTSAIVKAQLAYLGEAITEIDIRSKIEHGTRRIDHIISFLIRKLGTLWLERHTCTQLILFTNETQRYGCIMIIVSIFGIFT